MCVQLVEECACVLRFIAMYDRYSEHSIHLKMSRHTLCEVELTTGSHNRHASRVNELPLLACRLHLVVAEVNLGPQLLFSG